MSMSVELKQVFSNIEALLPEITERAAEGEGLRHLPADLAQKMVKAGAYHIVTPKSLGGFEGRARDFVESLELTATADASTSWCSMIANTAALSSAYMPHDDAQEIFGSSDAIVAGVFAPMGKAIDEGDHYRVTGRWQWGSGSMNSGWLSGGCMIWKDGEMQRMDNGVPVSRMVFFPADQAELLDTWHVAGLKGTGSGDIQVNDILVPKTKSVSLTTDIPVEQGALYKFPPFGLLSLGVCAVALGNARGALNEFRDLALAKKNQGAAVTLSEKETIQVAYAEMESQWRAARAYLYGEIDRVWDSAVAAEKDVPLDARADLRLACTHATRTSADICKMAYDRAGGVALFEHSPLQRRMRDALAATQHIVTAPATYELLGRFLFGNKAGSAMI